MKSTKIFNSEEFSAVCRKNAKNIRVQEVTNENISVQNAEHLFECNVTQPHKIENAVIVLPYCIKCKVTVDSLSLNLTRYVNKQQAKGSSGFSIGRYFVGDYKSGESVWNEKSLCVSLVGEISDRAGTIAAAVEIMRVCHLPRILILNEVGAMEIYLETNDANPLSQYRIKRVGN